MTTVVVGGGLAGALAARALDLSGEDVLVVDAGEEPGGIARASAVDGYLLEPAVGSLRLPHPALDPLLAGLGLDLRAMEPRTRRRFVRHRDRTIEVRPGPGLLGTPLLSAAGKLRVLGEPFVPPAGGDEVLEAFLVRRLGREAGRLAAWWMAAGVHAGDPAFLSVAAAFPALRGLEAEHGSLLRALLARRGGRPARSHVVAGGTAGLAAAVAASLRDRWRPCWRATRLERAGSGWRVHGPEVLEADHVVAAVGTDTLGELYPPLMANLPAAAWAPVAVVWVGFAEPVLPDGFGVLVGPDEQFSTLGFLYESSYAPDRAPAGRGLVKAIVGGATNPAAVTLPDGALSERVVDELSRVLGSAVDVDMTRVVRHRPGIPQYSAARRRMVEQLRESLPSGLEVCGWAYDGVGVGDLASAARRLAVR